MVTWHWIDGSSPVIPRVEVEDLVVHLEVEEVVVGEPVQEPDVDLAVVHHVTHPAVEDLPCTRQYLRLDTIAALIVIDVVVVLGDLFILAALTD